MPDFPGFQHLYRFSDPVSHRPLRGELRTNLDCFSITRGEIAAPERITVSWFMGGAMPSDLVWTGSGPLVIVHRRVIELLCDHGMTGWRQYAVTVIDRGGKSHPQYSGLVISGRCNSIDLSRSEIVLSEYPGGWFPGFLGHYFDEPSWDGSDFFMEREYSLGRGSANVFVTERVRHAFSRAKIKNVLLERLSDSVTSTIIYECGSEHLLPHDFSKRVDAAYRHAGVPRPKNKNIR